MCCPGGSARSGKLLAAGHNGLQDTHGRSGIDRLGGEDRCICKAVCVARGHDPGRGVDQCDVSLRTFVSGEYRAGDRDVLVDQSTRTSETGARDTPKSSGVSSACVISPLTNRQIDDGPLNVSSSSRRRRGTRKPERRRGPTARGSSARPFARPRRRWRSSWSPPGCSVAPGS